VLPEAEKDLELARSALISKELWASSAYLDLLEDYLLKGYVEKATPDSGRISALAVSWVRSPKAVAVGSVDPFALVDEKSLATGLDTLRQLYDSGARTFILPGPDPYSEASLKAVLEKFMTAFKSRFPQARIVLSFAPLDVLTFDTDMDFDKKPTRDRNSFYATHPGSVAHAIKGEPSSTTILKMSAKRKARERSPEPSSSDFRPTRRL